MNRTNLPGAGAFLLAAACLGAFWGRAASADGLGADFSRPSTREVASTAVLRAYLRTKEEVRAARYTDKPNSFCFVKQAPEAGVPGSGASVWMLWSEGREIVNRGDGRGGDLPPGEEADFAGRREAFAKSVNLDTDVVATPQDIAGSTYLVDRAWVDRLTSACRKIGRTVAVPPARAGGKR